VAYTYDGDGNRASLTDPNGSVIAYSHTARGQVASIVADGPPPLAAFAYSTGAEGGSGEIPRTRDPECKWGLSTTLNTVSILPCRKRRLSAVAGDT
jgi:hypothetical protein